MYTTVYSTVYMQAVFTAVTLPRTRPCTWRRCTWPEPCTWPDGPVHVHGRYTAHVHGHVRAVYTCTKPYTRGGVHGRVCIRPIDTAVYTVVYKCTRPVQNLVNTACVHDRVHVTAVYTAHTWPLHGPYNTRPYTAVNTAEYTGVYVYGPCTWLYIRSVHGRAVDTARVHDRIHGRVHGRLHVYTARAEPWTRPVYTTVYTAVYTAHTWPLRGPYNTRPYTAVNTAEYTGVYVYGPCTWLYIRPVHGSAVDTARVHDRIHGRVQAVYAAVYSTARTRTCMAVNTAMYARVHARVHGRVHGPCTGVHGRHTAVYSGSCTQLCTRAVSTC